MKEHPILFSGPMVRAILEGRKTQTRRVIRPQPTNMDDERRRLSVFADCLYGRPGDLLWVRETWAAIWTEYEPDEQQTIRDVPHRIEYRADTHAKYPGEWPDDSGGDPDCPHWRPSIHMPRWASRLILRLTDVRVQRVQEILVRDCIAEGVEPIPVEITGADVLHPLGVIPLDEKLIGSDYYSAFRKIWESINLKRGYGWDSNPWVWALTFAVESTARIDAYLKEREK